jgi:hypothetical protein
MAYAISRKNPPKRLGLRHVLQLFEKQDNLNFDDDEGGPSIKKIEAKPAVKPQKTVSLNDLVGQVEMPSYDPTTASGNSLLFPYKEDSSVPTSSVQQGKVKNLWFWRWSGHGKGSRWIWRLRLSQSAFGCYSPSEQLWELAQFRRMDVG